MEKNLDTWKNAFHMLSREELYMFDIIGLSDMIMSIEHAIHYTEGCRFLLLYLEMKDLQIRPNLSYKAWRIICSRSRKCIDLR